jgi:endonuclease/exonuclease/phosphatase family metal-dependent hydrolase
VALTHLDAFSLSDREYQAQLLARRYRAIDGPTILMGDMNAVPVTMVHERLFHRCDRTHRRLLDSTLMDSALAVATVTRAPSLARFATYPAGNPRWPLDWIFVSPHLRPIQLVTLATDDSDHAGVFARLALNTSTARVVETRAFYESLRRAARSPSRREP